MSEYIRFNNQICSKETKTKRVYDSRNRAKRASRELQKLGNTMQVVDQLPRGYKLAKDGNF